MSTLVKIEVDEDEDIKSGFVIRVRGFEILFLFIFKQIFNLFLNPT